MNAEVKSEGTSEIALTIVDSTSDIAHLNVINKEFSSSEPNSYGGLVLQNALGHVLAGSKMDEEVKSEVTSEIFLTASVDSTPDVLCLNEIKKEFSHVVENAEGKHKDTSIQSLNLQIKSEIPDLKCAIINGNDDVYIKLEPLVSEELQVKGEVEESLVDQILEQSTQIKHFGCTLCSSKFKFKKNLQQHLKIHTGEKPFQCNMCDYKCIQKSHLQTHIKTHTGEKPLQCSTCDYKCVKKCSLEQHMKTHTGEKPFQCNICDYRYFWKSCLQQHLKTHTGEKPFQCNICDYKFMEKRSLEQHMKRHTGERPFQCNKCDYKCIQKRSLEQHLKTHTGEKPFHCSICDYKCIRKSNLQRHLKTHTGITTFSDSQRSKLF